MTKFVTTLSSSWYCLSGSGGGGKIIDDMGCKVDRIGCAVDWVWLISVPLSKSSGFVLV